MQRYVYNVALAFSMLCLCAIVQCDNFWGGSYRSERYLEDLPEPKAGATFDRTSENFQPHTASNGTTATITIKNYLNETLFPNFTLPLLRDSDIVRNPCTSEIQPQTKEIFVVTDEFNASCSYIAGNSTMEIRAEMTVQEALINYNLAQAHYTGMYWYTFYRKQWVENLQGAQDYKMESDLSNVYVRLTSKLDFPDRINITIEIYRVEIEDIFSELRKLIKTTSDENSSYELFE